MKPIGRGTPALAKPAMAFIGTPTDIIISLATDAASTVTTTLNDVITLMATHPLVGEVLGVEDFPVPVSRQGSRMIFVHPLTGGSQVVAAAAKENFVNGSDGPLTRAQCFGPGTSSDLLLLAAKAGAAGNNLSVTYIDPPGTNVPLSITFGGAGGLLVVANAPGKEGNSLKVQVVVGAASVFAHMTGDVLTVNIPVGGSPVGDVANAINSAQGRMTAFAAGFTGSFVNAQGETPLVGGQDAMLVERGSMLLGTLVQPVYSGGVPSPGKRTDTLYVALDAVAGRSDTDADGTRWRAMPLSPVLEPWL